MARFAAALRGLAVTFAVALGLLALGVGFALQDLPAALRPAPSPPKVILLDNVSVLSMVPGAPMLEGDRALRIEEGRITAIVPAGSLAPEPGALMVDGARGFLMPGLIDAHVHLNDESELAAYLAQGVTGIRNMSGYPFHLDLPNRLESRTLRGPDFITTGRILNSAGPNANVLQHLVETAEEARAAVAAQADAGFTRIKVYSNLAPEAFDAVVDEAHRRGLPLTGHSPEGRRGPGVPYDMPFEIPLTASLKQSFTTLEHVESVVWHGLRDRLDPVAMGALAQTLAEAEQPITPTLIAHRRLLRIAESGGAYLERPGSEMINPFLRFIEAGAEGYWSAADPAPYERPHAEFFLTATGMLHCAGVPLLVGTDAGGFGLIPGRSVVEELALLVKAGLTPFEALEAATRVNAEVLGFPGAGQIAPGEKANLLLLASNPLEDFAAFEAPMAVAIRGEWLDAEALQALRDAAADTSFLRSAWRALEMLPSP